MMESSLAQKSFELTDEQLGSIPQISPDGTFIVSGPKYRLYVSITHAKQLQERISGLRRGMPSCIRKTFRFDEECHLEPGPHDYVEDCNPWAYRLKIRFPSLATYGVEWGVVCRKCKEERLFHEDDTGILLTRAELLEHCKGCYGARGLLGRLESEETVLVKYGRDNIEDF